MNAHAPTHEDVARRAYELWEAWGNPDGHDVEIWLMAERQLLTPTAPDNSPSETDGRGNGNTQESRTPADPQAEELKNPAARPTYPNIRGTDEAKRLRGELASESAVEYGISPPIPEDEAIKAALQKREARAPINPTKHDAAKAKPPESGKPLWNKSHSA
jgi:hypothetical protein